jgi:hypothetical protein
MSPRQSRQFYSRCPYYIKFASGLFENCHDTGKDKGVLSGQSPPNTPLFCLAQEILKEPVHREVQFSKNLNKQVSLIAFARALRYNTYCCIWQKETDIDDHFPHSRIL